MNISKFLAAAFAMAACCFAGDTRYWEQGERTDFEKGTLKNLSLRSDGRLFLAPEFHELFDSANPYLWTIAVDSKGNIYTAGGGSGTGTAKLFRVDTSGKSSTLAELDGLEIHAIAVDSKDAVYAATDPDGKVYKIGADGKSQLFYDPHAKYIWALAFNSKGDLFVATGDHGEVYRVTPAGSGSLFFKTDETHARSLAIDAQDNLLVGTEPSGLIVRVSPSGQGFVLHQAPKREITAVAVAKDGSIYAAGVGNKAPATPIAPVPLAPPAAPAQVGAPAGMPGGTTVRIAAAAAPIFGAQTAALQGGSEVYRIAADGAPRRIWSHAQDIVYAITFDREGRVILGTGNRGRIVRLDSDAVYTQLLDASPTQVTGFASGPKSELYAITGNIGKLYRIGPGLEKSGTFESEVLDAGNFAQWGRISFRGAAGVSVSTRAGNVGHPESNWSAWAPLQQDATKMTVCDRCGTGRTASPAARFLQYKVELESSATASAPELSYIDVAYLPKNIAPVVDQVEITPSNYRFPPVALTITPTNNITLPPLGQHRNPTANPLEGGASQTMNYAKGHTGARWTASDENGDALVYKVEVRGVKETAWKLLKEGVKDKYLSWDSTAFPDGEYVVRVTASDSPANPKDQVLEASLVSDPFLIDNTPPEISNLAASSSNGKAIVTWKARDALSNIDKAEYSVNGGEWLVVDPVNKLSDSPEEEYRLTLDRTPGEQVIAVRVNDEFDNQAVAKVVVQ